MILLPELWSTGYDLSNGRRLAAENQAVQVEISRLSNTFSISIGGAVLLENEGRIYNTFLLSAPGTADPVMYRKIHLFRLMKEDQWLAPGDRLQTVQAAWGKAGLAICYDLRFPVWARNRGDYDALLYVANWPARPREHWRALLGARAIENQCFVVGENRTGSKPWSWSGTARSAP